MSIRRSTIIWNKLGRLGHPAQAGLVCAVVAFVWLLVAPVAYLVSGTAGPWAAAAAASVCLFGAGLALAIAALFRGPVAAMHGMVLGMLARMLFPLLLGVALHLKVPSLSEAGMVYYLLIFYMPTLAAETMLLLARVPANAPSEETA